MITDEMLREAAFEVDRAMMDSLPDPDQCDHEFSPAFEAKMKKLIWRANYHIVFKALKRVACFFLAVILSAALLLAFNTEAQASVLDWVKNRFSEFYHYFFVGEEVQEHQEYSLGWVPDGYTLYETAKTANSKKVVYIDANEQLLKFTYVYGSDTSGLLLGYGECEQKTVALTNGWAEIYFAKDKNNTNIIVWKAANENVVFVISAMEEENILIKIAESLTLEKNN